MARNRWTAPLVAVALLAGPAVLLGWNGAAIASAAAAPWTTEAGAPAGPQVVAAGPTPVTTAPAPVPPTTSSTATEQAPEPRRTVVVVHKTVHSTVENEEDDMSTLSPEPGDSDVREEPTGEPVEQPADEETPVSEDEEPSAPPSVPGPGTDPDDAAPPPGEGNLGNS